MIKEKIYFQLFSTKFSQKFLSLCSLWQKTAYYLTWIWQTKKKVFQNGYLGRSPWVLFFVAYVLIWYCNFPQIIFFTHRLEAMTDKESVHSLRNLVYLISSLTSCGYQELRPNSIVYEAPFQVPGFMLPAPSGNPCKLDDKKKKVGQRPDVRGLI